MDLRKSIEPALVGLGYELVALESAGQGRAMRVFIDKPDGVNIDDCTLVSNHLTRLLAVEGFDYSRLEVSSPGLDRPLTRPEDFVRFTEQKARVRLRIPHAGQKNFVGILRGFADGVLQIEVDGKSLEFGLADLEKARLAPDL
ncbi:MAG: ribosome maturation factor RimP [Burkholderiales bacterium]|nr:ribosome maturation factor RimP [Pseudomonadota bacterium]